MNRLAAGLGFALACGGAASLADLAIRGQFPKAVVARGVPVSEDLDLVVAVSNVRVGLFLQHRREDGRIYRLVECREQRFVAPESKVPH